MKLEPSMNLDSIDEVLRAKGMKYDFDFCGWYTEGRSLKDSSTRKLFIPPFGITDKMLYERLSELKDKEG